MTFDEAIKPIVPNVDTLRGRFMNNEALMIKFMRRFVEDENFGQLETAISVQNFEDVYIHAHTLKGVSANLGLDYLSGACSDMIAYFREGGREIQRYKMMYEKVLEEYEKIISRIEMIE